MSVSWCGHTILWMSYSKLDVPLPYAHDRIMWVDASKMKTINEDSAREAGVPFVSTSDAIASDDQIHGNHGHEEI